MTFSEYTSDQDCATAGLVFECLSIRSCLRCSDDSQRSNWESRLITDLMRDYNRYARPTINVSKPVDTTIAFYLTKILGLVCIYIYTGVILPDVFHPARGIISRFFFRNTTRYWSSGPCASTLCTENDESKLLQCDTIRSQMDIRHHDRSSRFCRTLPACQTHRHE